jgi:hypothetical protein
MFVSLKYNIFIGKSQQKTCRSRFFDIEKQLNGLAEAQIRNGYFSNIIASITERTRSIREFYISVPRHK